MSSTHPSLKQGTVLKKLRSAVRTRGAFLAWVMLALACGTEQARVVRELQEGDAASPTDFGAVPVARDASADAARGAADAAKPFPDARDAQTAVAPDAGDTKATCLAPRFWTNHACGQWRDVRVGTTRRNGVWALAPNDAWMVGNGGSIVHWTGSTWSAVPSGVTTDLYGVWGIAANDVWAVGASGVTLHWDGTVWASRATGIDGYVSAIHGTGPNDVWVAGVEAVAHWTGSSWLVTRTNSTRWNALWMSSASFGFGVGQNGQSATFPTINGESTDNTAAILGVWGTATNNFWSTNARGDIQHWNGTAWSVSRADSIFNLRTLGGIWGAHADDVWVVGSGGVMFHWDGSAWLESDASPGFGSGSDLWAVSGSSAGDVWAAGDNGAVYRFSR